MKEETKKKLCKISKIVGFAITFGFAVFGALCAAMLIGNGSKKDDIKTLDSSLVLNEVRPERNIKPRKAPDLSDSYNYAEQAYHLDNVVFSYPGGGVLEFKAENRTQLYYFEDTNLPSGYYYVYGASGVEGVYVTTSDWSNVLQNVTSAPVSISSGYSRVTANRYIYIDWVNSPYSVLAFRYASDFRLVLVDTLDVPSSSILKLPNNWSPFALITDQVTDDNRFGLLNLGSPTSSTLVGPDIELTNIVFRFRGVVYDKIVFSFNDASHSSGYVRSDGSVFDPLNQYVVQNVDTHVMSLNYISFGQSWTNRYDKVVGARYSDKALPESPVDGVMWYPALGQYYWVNGGAPTIEIIELISETASGRYNNRYSNLDDLQLLELLSSYSAKTLDIGDTGMVFDLMTTAFNSLTPILSIYILPGLTLGMILFIPLIGGIIVVIIKVIKK